MTRDAFKKILKSEAPQPEAKLQILCERMQQLKVNAFLIDLVPGGNWWKFSLGWHGERFYLPTP